MLRSLTAFVLAFLLAAACVGQRLLPQSTRINQGGIVRALVEYDGKLIVGGSYAALNDHMRPNLQGWDGTNNYDMPGAFELFTDAVTVMLIFEGDLIVAGREANMGNIARWDGIGWQPMGSGIAGGEVMDLVEFDGALYAGAGYGTVYRWNGTAWDPQGEPLSTVQNILVNALAVQDGQLYAGGMFPERLVRWNGTIWEPVPPGLNSWVNDLKSTPEGLLVGGTFTSDGNELLDLPYYALYNGSTFTTPFGHLPIYSVTAFSDGPDASLIIGSNSYRSVLWNGAEAKPLLMAQVWTTTLYQSELFVGGSGLANRDSTALAVLEDGLELTYLDANDVRVQIMPSSYMFTRRLGIDSAPFEVPVGSGRTSMHFWVPLFSAQVDTGVFMQTPSQWDEGGSTGVHATVQDMEYHRRFHQVWRVDRDDVNYHIAHHNDPGYAVPYAIATWPGNGDVANGEPARVAPFADLNGNGIYEPVLGEYPQIRGDLAVYYVEHDDDDSSWYPQRALLDRHIMHYAFRNSWDPFLNQTVFTNIKLINRSDRTYANAHFGAFTGFGIGCDEDDLLGCDTTLSLSYVYNSQNTDQGCLGALGYGTGPPAQGVVWLSSPMSSSIDFDRYGFMGQPEEVVFHRALNGLRADGSAIVDPSGDTTTFEFYGEPSDPLQWNDVPSSAIPDRHPVSAIGPFTLAPGDTLCADLAFVFARDSAGGNLSSVTLLKERVAQLRSWYQQQNVQCNGSYGLATGIREKDEPGALLIYPNPAQDHITLKGAMKGPRSIQVLDMRGAIVLNETAAFSNATNEVAVASLPNGIYTVLVRSQSEALCARLVIAR